MRKEPLPFHFSKPEDGRERNSFSSRPSRRRPSPGSPLPPYSEILGLAQAELGADEALLIGERGRGGSRQRGAAAVLWNDESAAMGETAAR